jgi:hypothetical protein
MHNRAREVWRPIELVFTTCLAVSLISFGRFGYAVANDFIALDFLYEPILRNLAVSEPRIICENAVDDFWGFDFHNAFTGKSHILGL